MSFEKQSKRGINFEQSVQMAKAKFVEKLEILSLDFCKKDLAKDIKLIKEIIKEVEK